DVVRWLTKNGLGISRYAKLHSNEIVLWILLDQE
ncbi:hypothetical protein A2U01_0104278, partial [Trifolium medium]|nr:hypothetical protein [Trifolium medium]